jgi:hypothetical protein
MKAVRFHEYGDADVLRYEEVEEPVPDPEEVRIRVAATAFNPVDAGIRGGFLREAFPVALPHVPGIDVAGTVDAVGAPRAPGPLGLALPHHPGVRTRRPRRVVDGADLVARGVLCAGPEELGDLLHARGVISSSGISPSATRQRVRAPLSV